MAKKNALMNFGELLSRSCHWIHPSMMVVGHVFPTVPPWPTSCFFLSQASRGKCYLKKWDGVPASLATR